MSPYPGHDVVGWRPLGRPAFRVFVLLLALALALLIPPGSRAVAAPPDRGVPAAYDQDYRPQFHFSAEEELAERPERTRLPQGHLPPLLPVQPEGQHLGQHELGTRDLPRPGALDRAAGGHPQTLNSTGESIEDIFSGVGGRRHQQHLRLRHQEQPPAGRRVHQRLHPKPPASRHPGPVTGLQHRPTARPGPSTPATRCSTSARATSAIRRCSGTPRAGQWRDGRRRAAEHKVAHLRLADLKSWTHLRDFGPANAVGGAWECPDLFPLPSTATRATSSG